MMLLMLQDGSDIVCVGVDTLNAETREVMSQFIPTHIKLSGRNSES